MIWDKSLHYGGQRKMITMERRTRRAAEQILSNSALTADLGDGGAALMDWAVAALRAIATTTTAERFSAERELGDQMQARANDNVFVEALFDTRGSETDFSEHAPCHVPDWPCARIAIRVPCTIRSSGLMIALWLPAHSISRPALWKATTRRW